MQIFSSLHYAVIADFMLCFAESTGAGVDLLAATLAGIGLSSTPTTTTTSATHSHHTPSSPSVFRYVLISPSLCMHRSSITSSSII
jgi:hypothetical protein